MFNLAEMLKCSNMVFIYIHMYIGCYNFNHVILSKINPRSYFSSPSLGETHNDICNLGILKIESTGQSDTLYILEEYKKNIY